jgi:SAM-dependent methyltransferase
MSFTYYERKVCRLCHSEQMEMAMPLNPTPIGDRYLPEDRKEETRENIPLDLFLCADCGHLQVGAIINPNLIYDHYLSRPAAVNSVLSDAYRGYAQSIVERYQPGVESLIVEMGSNDGAFLNFFKERGIPVLGVDPAQNLAEVATKNGVPTITTFFAEAVAEDIVREHGNASVFIANFVFANIDDVDDVIKGVCKVLARDGVFMFETNSRVDIFQKFLIEAINHEHASYFAVKSLQTFLARHGLELINVEHMPAKGGALRYSAQFAGGPHAVQSAVEDYVRQEEELGVYTTEFYQECDGKIRSVREEMGGRLAAWKKEGKTFAGYGTSIGATILIYQLGLGTYLDFLVDDDPYRQNLVSPGFHIPVVSAEQLHEQRPDYVVILAPLYAESIMHKNKDYADKGGHFINIWPDMTVY